MRKLFVYSTLLTFIFASCISTLKHVTSTQHWALNTRNGYNKYLFITKHYPYNIDLERRINTLKKQGYVSFFERSDTAELTVFKIVFSEADSVTINTADVRFSDGIRRDASNQDVIYEHRHAEYRIVKGEWKFRFSKVVSKNYSF